MLSRLRREFSPRLAFWAGVLAASALLLWNGLSSLYMMTAFVTPLPIGDQWDSAYFPDHFVQSLFALHNEHRPALARLVGWLDWHWANGDNDLNIAFIALCFPLFAVAIHGLLRLSGIKAGRALAATAIAMAIQTSGEQWENLSWGFQTAFVGSFAFAALALFCAARVSRSGALSARSVLYFGLCITSSLLSVFALASGLFTLVGVCVLLWVSDARRPFKWVYPVLAVAVTAAYLTHYSTPGDHSNPLHSVSHPFTLMRYILTYLGGPLAPGGNTIVAACIGSLGAIILAIMAADALRLTLKDSWIWRSAPGTAYLTVLILSGAIVGAALMAALGRLAFGPLQAMSSRYGTPALAFWADLIVLGLIRAQLTSGPLLTRLRQGAAILGLLLAAQLAMHQIGYVNLVHRINAERMRSAMAYMVGVRGEPALSLYPVADVVAQGALDGRFQSLQQQHKAIFAQDWPARLGTRLLGWTGSPQGACKGVVDARSTLPGESRSTQRLGGWAWMADQKRPADLVAFVDDQGKVVGFAEPGFMRKGLKKALHSRAAVFSGFLGYAPGGPLTSYQVYAISRAHNAARSCALAVSG